MNYYLNRHNNVKLYKSTGRICQNINQFEMSEFRKKNLGGCAR